MQPTRRILCSSGMVVIINDCAALLVIVTYATLCRRVLSHDTHHPTVTLLRFFCEHKSVLFFL